MNTQEKKKEAIKEYVQLKDYQYGLGIPQHAYDRFIDTLESLLEPECEHKNTYHTPTSKHGVKGVHTRCQDCQNIVSTTYEN